MDSLLIAPFTKAQLVAMQAQPPHALALVGPAGIGKHALATAWAGALTPYIITISPDEKGTIGIETVRTLYRQTRSKHAERQVVIIDHAQAMGADAQNTFLKLLEEPPAGVIFVVTTPTLTALLPTITSRLQTVQVLRVADAELTKHAAGVNRQDLAQLLFIANGRPAVFMQLAQNNDDFAAHRQLMQRAKWLLTASAYERLALVGELSKDKTALIALLEATARMVQLQLARTPLPKWHAFAQGLDVCLQRLAQNGNPRAQLTYLFTQA